MIRAAFALALALCLVPMAAHADDDDTNMAKGKLVFRGGAGINGGRAINLGGSNTGGTPIVGHVNLGAGYFIIPKLSLDADADLRFRLSPDQSIDTLGITPGARYYPPKFVIRVGVPIVIIPDFNVGILGGIAYRQPLGKSVYFVLGVDYTYWISGPLQNVAPLGRVDINAGVQAHF